jgi:hypothetical protein
MRGLFFLARWQLPRKFATFHFRIRFLFRARREWFLAIFAGWTDRLQSTKHAQAAQFLPIVFAGSHG